MGPMPRRKDKSCEVLHPSLCRTAHKGVYLRAKRLALRLCDAAHALEPSVGRGLFNLSGIGDVCRGQRSCFIWQAHKLMKPKQAFFVQALAMSPWLGADLNLKPGVVIKLQAPLVHVSSFGLAIDMLRNAQVSGLIIDSLDWKCCLLKWKNVDLQSVRVIGVQQEATVSCKVLKSVKASTAAEDALEQAMLDVAAKSSSSSKAAKAAKAGKSSSSSSSSSSEEDLHSGQSSSSEDKSEISVGPGPQVRAGPVVPVGPVVFFLVAIYHHRIIATTVAITMTICIICCFAA